RIMTRLHEKGGIGDGDYLEFLQSHTNVVFQPAFDDPRFSGFNPYALGFSMMCDIARIVKEPEDEDREWFPDIAGTGDEVAGIRGGWSSTWPTSGAMTWCCRRSTRPRRCSRSTPPARGGWCWSRRIWPPIPAAGFRGGRPGGRNLGGGRPPRRSGFHPGSRG